MSSNQNQYDSFDPTKSENSANDKVSYEYRNKYSYRQNLDNPSNDEITKADADLETASDNLQRILLRTNNF